MIPNIRGGFETLGCLNDRQGENLNVEVYGEWLYLFYVSENCSLWQFMLQFHFL